MACALAFGSASFPLQVKHNSCNLVIHNYLRSPKHLLFRAFFGLRINITSSFDEVSSYFLYGLMADTRNSRVMKSANFLM